MINTVKRVCQNNLTHPLLIEIGRDEATRTPDPYVPNVVRYQLRYIPITFDNQRFIDRFLLIS